MKMEKELNGLRLSTGNNAKIKHRMLHNSLLSH